jgi:SAM-dependent methyltransferase
MLPTVLTRFALPRIYVAGQYAVGAQRLRRMCIDALAARAGERLLDIGCGPAYYCDWLPNVDYFGFDTDEPAIAWAQQRFAGRGRFFAAIYDESHREAYGPFDAVLLMGLLHHLDDTHAEGLLDLVARSLKPGGRVISLDTCYDDRMSRRATWLASRDRGQYVRRPADFEAMVAKRFDRVTARLVGDSGSILTAQWLMEFSSPKNARS